MGEESPKGYMKQRWIELDGGKDLRGAGMKAEMLSKYGGK